MATLRFLAVPSLLAAAGLLAACSSEKPPATHQIPEVGVVTVSPQVVPYPITFVAQTESSRQVEIVARVAGFLDRIAYSEGDFVKEGQVLFQIDPKPFKAQLEAAQGELAAQKARLTTATATLARTKPLAEQNALSKADLDRANGDYEASNAAVFSASAKVREAELNLGYATIRSPVSGSASRALQREGAYVGASADTAKLTYVAALDPIWVTFSVSQNQVAQMQELIAKKVVQGPGDQKYDIELVLPGGKVFPHRGKINFADPSFSSSTGTFMVRASLPNPNKELRPGMFVTANMVGATRPSAIVVPQLAVQQGPKGNFVVVANAKDMAEVRPVRVGSYAGDKDIVVEQGLAAGDRVIVDGLVRVVPNAPVKPVPAGKPKNGGGRCAGGPGG
ncbi:efflux RND transporter periplasmic adaptor subunit [Sulfurisoma sediminicola]|uniref:efflux RND transporter periplasmic adaptor subunit n=1 Tax=Sulfurisoma sediminicola TaxID=1381557 RepID=UPI001A9D1FFE|nr:efflux RND transporter periplasmic adaptor subunit [Sulfurisoma sediminicola]